MGSAVVIKGGRSHNHGIEVRKEITAVTGCRRLIALNGSIYRPTGYAVPIITGTTLINGKQVPNFNLKETKKPGQRHFRINANLLN